MRVGPGPLSGRFPGIPLQIAVAYAAIGFSLYFSIGVVARFGLGLTPLIFLAAGLLLVLATLTYVEGGAMFAERGGSASFARHAFNELISFIAGWAILIDYIIVVSFAAISVAHYLGPIWGGFTHGWVEIAVAAWVIAFAAAINIGGFTRYVRQRPLIALALADVVLQIGVIVRRGDRRLPPRSADRPRGAVHDPLGEAPARGAGGRHPGVRRDRGGVRSGAGLQLASEGPAHRGRRQRARAAPDLRRDGRDRADGGAGGRAARTGRTPRSGDSSSRSRCSGW